MQRSLALLGHVSPEQREQSKESEYGERRETLHKVTLRITVLLLPLLYCTSACRFIEIHITLENNLASPYYAFATFAQLIHQVNHAATDPFFFFF